MLHHREGGREMHSSVDAGPWTNEFGCIRASPFVESLCLLINAAVRVEGKSRSGGTCGVAELSGAIQRACRNCNNNNNVSTRA